MLTFPNRANACAGCRVCLGKPASTVAGKTLLLVNFDLRGVRARRVTRQAAFEHSGPRRIEPRSPRTDFSACHSADPTLFDVCEFVSPGPHGDGVGVAAAQTEQRQTVVGGRERLNDAVSGSQSGVVIGNVCHVVFSRVLASRSLVELVDLVESGHRVWCPLYLFTDVRRSESQLEDKASALPHETAEFCAPRPCRAEPARTRQSPVRQDCARRRSLARAGCPGR